jgi:Family of unknown function (DUF5670)
MELETFQAPGDRRRQEMQDRRCRRADACCQSRPLLEKLMLWTMAVILMVLWALGLASSYSLGGYIHILPAVALVVMAAGFLQGRGDYR